MLVILLWTLLVLARPLAGCKPALVTTTTGVAAMIVAVPALGTGVFLLNPAPLPLLVEAMAGAAGATLAEVSCRAAALATRGGSPESRKEGIATMPADGQGWGDSARQAGSHAREYPAGGPESR